MIITIDYNNNRITLQNEENDPEVMTYNKVKDLRKMQEFLYEMINMINGKPNGDLDVKLEMIDEYSRKTLGEW